MVKAYIVYARFLGILVLLPPYHAPPGLIMSIRNKGMLEINYGIIATVAAAAAGRTYMKFVRGPEPKSVDMSGKVRHGRRLRVATGQAFDELIQHGIVVVLRVLPMGSLGMKQATPT